MEHNNRDVTPTEPFTPSCYFSKVNNHAPTRQYDQITGSIMQALNSITVHRIIAILKKYLLHHRLIMTSL